MLTCHCTVGPGLPLAAALNVASPPAHTVRFVGLLVTTGAVFTVNATRVEVCDAPHVPLTTQSNPVPAVAASPVAVPRICNVAVVTPL